MIDFLNIKKTENKGVIKITPAFSVKKSTDLMIKGGEFYAAWDSSNSVWTTDLYRVIDIINESLYLEWSKTKDENPETSVVVETLTDFNNNHYLKLRRYMNNLPDSYVELDKKIFFSNDTPNKNDYSSMTLSYPRVSDTSSPSYDELISTLYDPEERNKIEWGIGSIFYGESIDIEKMFILFGKPGTGKSTILKIISLLFEGYCSTIDIKGIVENTSFSTELLNKNSLVLIQHEADLSFIRDNSILNSIVSHDETIVKEKYKKSYTIVPKGMIFACSNKPVQMGEKTGLTRRLIDITPTGNTIPYTKYKNLISRIEFELPQIAQKCVSTFLKLGKDYYDSYIPEQMFRRTNIIHNFIQDNREVFSTSSWIPLKKAYNLFKLYCAEVGCTTPIQRHKFASEFGDYFMRYDENHREKGSTYPVQSVFGLKENMLELDDTHKFESEERLFECENSILDSILSECPAQYANENGTPYKKWSKNNTKLKDIDTQKLHFVIPMSNMIVVDIDFKTPDGKKDTSRCIEYMNTWPETYAELSKGGGVHLHYYYDGDISQIKKQYSDNVEILSFKDGSKSSLRRKLTKCNNKSVSKIQEYSIPKKTYKKKDGGKIKSEKSLRNLVERNLRKEIHGDTRSSCDFINKILNDAKNDGLVYDVTDLRHAVLRFAMNSTNQSEYCIKLVANMPFKNGVVENEYLPSTVGLDKKTNSNELTFFDTEVFPNLFVVTWKKHKSSETNAMVNPSPEEITSFILNNNLVGFNNKRYDNHILYARHLGYDNNQLYKVSKKIIEGGGYNIFGSVPYGLSYTDVYDFAHEKKSLKKYEISLGISHKELGLPWDEPVADSDVDDVVNYCKYDTIATEKLFDHLQGDWNARLILSKLSGLTPNDSTNDHTSRIVFGNERSPKLNYTDLSIENPEYTFKDGVYSYKGVDIGQGGWVLAKPGVYKNVALLDVESMYPTSAILMNAFGDYTDRFKSLLEARLLIKHKDFKAASKLLDGKLVDFLDEDNADALSQALKIAINSVYGLTFASFDNPFRSIENKDNFIAKKGALFMIDLYKAIESMGYNVVHVKVDSVKIENADSKIIDYVHEFGLKHGYKFEHEDTYNTFALINKSEYIAFGKHGWVPVGKTFKEPYVFKKLFTKEPILFEDLPQTKSASTAMYLWDDTKDIKKFVGKVGSFIPTKSGSYLVRKNGEKYDFVGGTKNYKWIETESISIDDRNIDSVDIDFDFYNNMANKVKKSLINIGYDFGEDV